MISLQQIHDRVEQLKGQRQQIAADVEAAAKRIATLTTDVDHAREARAIIQTVAQTTQKELEFHISEICSLALAAVFDDPYTLRLEFVARRNKTEADIYFERGGDRVKPVDASGGGAVDVVAIALRVAMWSLRRPRSRNTLVLDEPLKMLSRDLMPKAAAMIAELSKRLGLQIIMVSHSAELIEAADRWFDVTISRRVSHVKEGDGSDRQEGHQSGDRQIDGPGEKIARRDTGGARGEQRAMDADTADSIPIRLRRGQGGDEANNGERPQGLGTDRAPRRGRG